MGECGEEKAHGEEELGFACPEEIRGEDGAEFFLLEVEEDADVPGEGLGGVRG